MTLRACSQSIDRDTIKHSRKWLHAWWRPRSSKPLSRMENMRLVGSIPMHFRHFFARS